MNTENTSGGSRAEKMRLEAIKRRDERLKRQQNSVGLPTVSGTTQSNQRPNVDRHGNTTSNVGYTTSNSDVLTGTAPAVHPQRTTSVSVPAVRPIVAGKSQVNSMQTNSVRPSTTDILTAIRPRGVASTSYTSGPSSSAPAASNASVAPVFGKTRLRVSCSLVSALRFVADFKYNAALVDTCKTMSSRQYNAQDRSWSFALDEYCEFESRLKSHPALDVDFVPLPDVVKRLFLAPRTTRYGAVDSVDLTTAVDAALYAKLFPFQRHGVRFCVSRNGRALIADDMGLGKTLQAIAVARYYARDWPLLIVCPSSVRFTWRHEILTNLPSVTEDDIRVLEKGTDPLPERNRNKAVVITSYDLLTSKQRVMKEYGFGVVVLDESHCIKDFKAQRTKAADAVASQASRVLLLSGTPALSRPAELFQQIRTVDKRLFPGGFPAFAKRYCDGKQGTFGFEAKGATNTTELDVILKETIMIRRMKTDVMRELPEKRRQMVVLDHSSIRKNLKRLQEARAMIETTGTSDRHRAILEYYAETALAKATAVCDYVVEQLETSGRKLLVFAHHQTLMDQLSMAVAKARCTAIRIDGSTSSQRRQTLCDQFQSDSSDTRVALLSITAAGTGLTLTNASMVIFAELFWNPGVLVQAEDRAYRLGQTDSVLVQYLVATGTADDLIWPLIQKKLDVLLSVGLSEENFHDASTIISEDTEKQLEDDKKCQSTLDRFLESISTDKPEIVFDETLVTGEPKGKCPRIL